MFPTLAAVLVLLSVPTVDRTCGGAQAQPVPTDPFRPPAVPIITFAPMQQKYLMGDHVAAAGGTKYWDGSPMPITVLASLTDQKGATRVWQLLGDRVASADVDYANQTGFPEVRPTQTIIHFTVPAAGVAPAAVALTLTFVSPMLPDDLDVMSRPIAYIRLDIVPAQPQYASHMPASAQLYVDATADNCVHLGQSELVSWPATSTEGPSVAYLRMGTAAQDVLGSCGDEFMLDWGHMYLGTGAARAQFSAGPAATIRERFVANGTLPPIATDAPAWSNSTPALAAVSAAEQASAGAPLRATVMFAYDDVYVQYYFGDRILPRWKMPQNGNGQAVSIGQLLETAWQQRDKIYFLCEELDASLLMRMTDRFGLHYARVASLAYRQAFAAIELGFDPTRGEYIAFLKEISSDGDVNTMDVIFPASPLFIYTAPEVLKQLLIPVLRYANNETWMPFTDPFSPHQLGTYPISNLSSSGQEIMPLENTGNMFMLLLAYTQRTNGEDIFFAPFWNVLSRWATYMVTTQLPDPPNQICTDDFAGPLAQNTNLAAKGMVALRAFHDLCELMKAAGNPIGDCAHYRNRSIEFADWWTEHAVENDGSFTYSKLAYNLTGTWSTKYNLLWQKLLQLGDEPFRDYKQICRDEISQYTRKLNTFGFPMDLRHTFQKLDWMTWGASLADDRDTFVSLFDRVYLMANSTGDRWPLTDLYDTVFGSIVYYFRSRPVVGAVFAPMLLHDL